MWVTHMTQWKKCSTSARTLCVSTPTRLHRVRCHGKTRLSCSSATCRSRWSSSSSSHKRWSGKRRRTSLNDSSTSPSRGFRPSHGAKLYDDPSRRDRGWSFLQDPRIQWPVVGHSWMHDQLSEDPQIPSWLVNILHLPFQCYLPECSGLRSSTKPLRRRRASSASLQTSAGWKHPTMDCISARSSIISKETAKNTGKFTTCKLVRLKGGN